MPASRFRLQHFLFPQPTFLSSALSLSSFLSSVQSSAQSSAQLSAAYFYSLSSFSRIGIRIVSHLHCKYPGSPYSPHICCNLSDGAPYLYKRTCTVCHTTCIHGTFRCRLQDRTGCIWKPVQEQYPLDICCCTRFCLRYRLGCRSGRTSPQQQ